MDYNQLEKILNYLILKGQPIIIVLIYADWEKTIPQHSLITQHFDKEKVAFFACHTSNLHSVAFGGGFDLVSLIQVRGHPNNQKLHLNKIRFLDPKTLNINNIENTLNTSDRDLIKELSLPPDNSRDLTYLSQLINGYRGAIFHHKKFQILYYLARTHEAITSPTIFDQTRKVIEKKEMMEYIAQTNLKNAPIIKSRHY